MIAKAKPIEDLGTVTNSITSLLIGNLVAALNRHVVAAGVVGLGDGNLVDGWECPDLGTGSDCSSQNSDDGESVHFEGLKVIFGF